MIYVYGGGNVAGDGSEPSYDGARLAQRGIITLTANYRLNIFGFFAHPELTQESPQHASGNYGYLDQAAALRWVHENIAAFGGDPGRVTIAGESAGSISVSALMISPLAGSVPAYATAPALLFVGCLMLRDLVELDWEDTTEVIPAAVTALAMPFTYSIANGLAFGFITYAVLKLFTGRAREVHAMVRVIAAIFLFKFAYIGGH